MCTRESAAIFVFILVRCLYWVRAFRVRLDRRRAGEETQSMAGPRRNQWQGRKPIIAIGDKTRRRRRSAKTGMGVAVYRHHERL